ncbi:MAG: hypothetical protein QOH12_2134 [Solirubrobacteraceae bacterium]|jgi:hypothetical protein|nr:hypothetical protein [Solirubrobacteraceae bacterium]
MTDEKVRRRLPVIDGHTLIGIVSQADLATAIDDEQIGELVAAISAALTDALTTSTGARRSVCRGSPAASHRGIVTLCRPSSSPGVRRPRPSHTRISPKLAKIAFASVTHCRVSQWGQGGVGEIP